MPKIDIDNAPTRFGSAYPAPFDAPCRERKRRKLGDVAGLDQFGVNLMRLAPGAWTSQRHWHTHEDEFVWVVSGEVVLVEDAGETILRAGDCAGFKAGVPNGHHIQNRSDAEAVLLEVGSRRPGVDAADYPDLDMIVTPDDVYRHRDGTPYELDEGRRR
jgi:uncharacterized cupin superfamily protein